MKKLFAEYLKVVSRLGLSKGSGLMLKKIAGRNKEFSVKLYNDDPLIIRDGKSDWTVFKQVFIWREYEYPYLFNVNTIIDAGANVGYAAIWFANRFPRARIISLEPETSNFENLKKNTSKNGNITCLKAGLWNKSTLLKIKDDSVENWGFRTIEVDSPNEHTIQAFNLFDIMEKYGISQIDILKLDVEGAEKVIFESNYESWLPLVKCLIIELHDFIDKDCSKKFFKVISSYDFSFDVLGENLFFFNNRIK